MGVHRTSYCEVMVTARRMDLTEEHTIYSQSTVFFDAATTAAVHSRRTASVGPGLALDHDEDEHSEGSDRPPHGRQSSSISRNGNGEHEDVRRGRDPRPPIDRPFAQDNVRRNLSVDQANYQRSFVSHNVHNADEPPPIPPYAASYYYSPQTTSVSARTQRPSGSRQRSLEDMRHDYHLPPDVNVNYNSA